MNIEKLIRTGRLVPIHKTNDKGETHIVGYGRRSHSRKKNQQYLLRKPIPVESTPAPDTIGQVPVPPATSGALNAGS